ncbi:hypothetical protein KP509_27G009400 [Ceratopteris richardii]|nr:hypothetical protein KP509_27G009400 [Ceratopteris richardii]
MQHAFAYTYGLPSAVANYTPPSYCSTPWDQIVLKWSGTCKGRQYDRIAAVWFGGVEILRTCTAEPTSSGIYWEVRKDVTRFASVFKEPQLVVLELANVVDDTYTGIFNINLTLEIYSSKRHLDHVNRVSDNEDIVVNEGIPSHNAKHAYNGNLQCNFEKFVDGPGETTSSLVFPANSPADLIIPIAKADGLSGGHWFDLTTESDIASVSFNPPKNIYRAVLEVCVSFHGTDEFWYTNPPTDYLEANGLTGYPGNGTFREVQIFLDDVIVGAVWPFPVIFTGGINPLYWRPAAAIGAYNLPSYDIEITPFVGLFVDGAEHTISMSVKNADGSWPVNGNLHLWLDPCTSQTLGGLLNYDAPLSSLNTELDFEGLDGTFHTSAGRKIASSGYIVSSLGTLLVSASYSYEFENILVYQNSSSVQIVTQDTMVTGEIIIKTPSNVVFSQHTTSSFPFYLSSSDYSGANSMYTEECNLTHAFNQDILTVSSSVSMFESLKNSQAAEGSMTVVGSSVTTGIGALQQHFDFQSSEGCYDRILHTKNYSISYDVTDLSCQVSKASL